jgi:hypothetical protein
MLSPIEADTWIPPASKDRVPWRPTGVVIHALKDVLYPYDSRVVRAVRREFDPAIIPVMVLRAYRCITGEERVYRVHAIASHQPQKLRVPAWSERVLLPLRGKPVPRPTHMDLHLEDRAERRGDGLPGQHLQFDWRVYQTLRTLYQEWSAREVALYEEEHGRGAQAQRALDKANERTAKITGQDTRWLKARMENILTAPPRELRKALIERARRRQAMVFIEEARRGADNRARTDSR